MAYTTIKKSSDYFNTKLYTGNGGTQTISGIGFQPDFTWVKGRNHAYYHYLQDAVRGSSNVLYTNNNDAESTGVTAGISAWNSDGYVTGSQGALNYNGRTFVAWNWKANGAGSANTVGSVNSTVSVNTTSGFSIVSWQGTDANASIGHGLSKAPTMVFYKTRGLSESWVVYNKQIGAGNKLVLNTTAAASSSSTNFQNGLDPNNSVLYVGANSANKNTPMIAYCFTDVQGFSKIGSYTGNGNADGSLIYTGFSPAFVMIKETTGTGKWVMKDNRRTGINVNQSTIYANESEAEGTPGYELIDLLSNGFKQRGTGSYVNGSGTPYIYMAFAEAPLVGDNPATAR